MPRKKKKVYHNPKRETLRMKPKAKDMVNTETMEKVASNDVSITRMQLGSQGHDGLRTNYGHVLEHAIIELRWPEAICTYSKMALDPTIAAVNNFYNMMISRAEFKFEAPVLSYDEYKEGYEDEGLESLSEAEFEAQMKKSKAAARYLNYCKNNMQGQTWNQFISGIGTYRIYGFSIAEKVWTTVPRGKYKGRKKWKSLSQRAQFTVDKWKWDKKDPEKLTGVVQRPTAFDVDRYGTQYSGDHSSEKQRTIDRNKFILFRFDPKVNNPQGTSPLDGCWEAWKYLQLVREYQAIGVAKDLGGIPVIGVPVEKMIEAAADPSGAAAQTIEALKANAAALHAGDESYVIKPIDYTDGNKDLYTFELIGINGGGKQYDTQEIIRQYQNEILTCYSASMLKMGQDATGSFALSDNMNNLLAFGVQHNLDIITQQINVDLIPQTLAINGWLLEEEFMPKLTYGDIAPRDLDEVGKFIQRAVTSGAMTIGKGLDQDLRKMADLPQASYAEEDKIPEGFSTAVESNAGQGDGTSGTGNSQAGNGDNNKENAS